MRKLLSSVALKKILETTNERDLFIVGHMYIENTIDRILERKMWNCWLELGIDMRINWSQTSRELQITFVSYSILDMRLSWMVNMQNIEFVQQEHFQLWKKC